VAAQLFKPPGFQRACHALVVKNAAREAIIGDRRPDFRKLAGSRDVGARAEKLYQLVENPQIGLVIGMRLRIQCEIMPGPRDHGGKPGTERSAGAEFGNAPERDAPGRGLDLDQVAHEDAVAIARRCRFNRPAVVARGRAQERQKPVDDRSGVDHCR
jgi:hypothetical protein